MQQVVDLQNDPDFIALNVALVSIAVDSLEEQLPAAESYGINVPMLSDPDKMVSEMYDILKWALTSGEPSHTFVLVDEAGFIAWIRDYGAPDNPERTMYVPLDDLNAQIKAGLSV